LRNTFDTSRKLISGMSTSYMAKGPNSRRSHARMRNEQRLEEARAVQGRMAFGRTLSTRRRHRHQHVEACRKCRRFLQQTGTCEQWIKEGKGAIKWARLSCRSFAANAVRLQLHALAYNLGNFLRSLATQNCRRHLILRRREVQNHAISNSTFSSAPPSTMVHGVALAHDNGGSTTLRFAKQAKSSLSNCPISGHLGNVGLESAPTFVVARNPPN